VSAAGELQNRTPLKHLKDHRQRIPKKLL